MDQLQSIFTLIAEKLDLLLHIVWKQTIHTKTLIIRIHLYPICVFLIYWGFEMIENFQNWKNPAIRALHVTNIRDTLGKDQVFD